MVISDNETTEPGVCDSGSDFGREIPSLAKKLREIADKNLAALFRGFPLSVSEVFPEAVENDPEGHKAYRTGAVDFSSIPLAPEEIRRLLNEYQPPNETLGNRVGDLMGQICGLEERIAQLAGMMPEEATRSFVFDFEAQMSRIISNTAGLVETPAMRKASFFCVVSQGGNTALPSSYREAKIARAAIMALNYIRLAETAEPEKKEKYVNMAHFLEGIIPRIESQN